MPGFLGLFQWEIFFFFLLAFSPLSCLMSLKWELDIGPSQKHTCLYLSHSGTSLMSGDAQTPHRARLKGLVDGREQCQAAQ